jgi:4-hydroxybenzoyl-CoA reductase gamma subunit
MAEVKNKTNLSCTVNGRASDNIVSDSLLLADFLRETLGLTGTKIGCDGGECGCCTVLIDNAPQHACLTLAAKCNGKAIETIESLSEESRLSAIQRGFNEKLGAQCGFCTPGMVMSAVDLIKNKKNPSDQEIRDWLEGNICRCTGYQNIVAAVKEAASNM